MAFYYIYKPLAHPEYNNYVSPFTIEERLMHVKEAERTLGSKIPWLSDTMDNAFHAAMGGAPNCELIVAPDGRVVVGRGWSDPVALRKDLERLVGRVEEPTRVADLNLEQLPPPSTVAKGVVPRIDVPKGMWPLQVDAQVAATEVPFYVKLRAEADPALLATGSGQMYVGFHLDPLYRVHWNNEAKPVEFQITTPEGIRVTPAKGVGPTVAEPADADPREFLVDVTASDNTVPLDLAVKYYACDDALTFCIPVQQQYQVSLQRDRSHGWSMRTAPDSSVN